MNCHTVKSSSLNRHIRLYLYFNSEKSFKSKINIIETHICMHLGHDITVRVGIRTGISCEQVDVFSNGFHTENSLGLPRLLYIKMEKWFLADFS